jgi:MFS family permease
MTTPAAGPRGRPILRTWPAYLAIATVGFLLYGLGAVGPYLRTQLGLSDTEVGLHPTFVAIGLVLAGAMTAGLHRRFGERAVRVVALVSLVAALVAIAAAPALPITLGAMLVIGWGTGTVLGYANAALGTLGGSRSRVALARANVWAMVTGFLGPVLLGLAVGAGAPWWLGLGPGLLFLGLLLGELRRTDVETATLADERSGDHPPLPRGYWQAWAFLVAAIAAEFSIVYWGSTLVERRAGVPTAEATVVGALFLAGMFAGRLVYGQGWAGGRDVRALAAGGTAVAGAGAVIAWVGTSALVVGLGLFVAGAGVAALYPLGTAAALGTAPDRLAHAGARLTLASGSAILVAPFVLGAIADAAGVVVGWGLVVVILVVALLLVPVLPRAEPGEVPVIAGS